MNTSALSSAQTPNLTPMRMNLSSGTQPSSPRLWIDLPTSLLLPLLLLVRRIHHLRPSLSLPSTPPPRHFVSSPTRTGQLRHIAPTSPHTTDPLQSSAAAAVTATTSTAATNNNNHNHHNNNNPSLTPPSNHPPRRRTSTSHKQIRLSYRGQRNPHRTRFSNKNFMRIFVGRCRLVLRGRGSLKR